MSATTTAVAPSRANRVASPAPIPLPPPVTTTIFPATRIGRCVLDEDDPHDEIVGEVFESVNHPGRDEERITGAERPSQVTCDKRAFPGHDDVDLVLIVRLLGVDLARGVELYRNLSLAEQLDETLPFRAGKAGQAFECRALPEVRQSVTANSAGIARSASGDITAGSSADACGSSCKQ